MFNKILLPFLILLLLPIMVIAQEVIEKKVDKAEKIYWMNTRGEFVPLEAVQKYQKPQYNDNLKRNIFGDILFNPDDTEDTLCYRDLFAPAGNFNFGFFGQDRMTQFFRAPADMRIIAAGVMCVAKDVKETQTSLKLVNFAWDLDEISTITTASWLGYYEATGNGYNDVTAYLDDPDITGGWTNADGNAETSPFGNDLWSDGGVGFPFTPVINLDPLNDLTYDWVQMNILFEPEVLAGDIIGVSTKNLHPTMDAERVGWYAAQSTGIPLAFKFYQNGRLIVGVDFGWWQRDFTWDYCIAVVITGDTPPNIESFTELATTLSTDPQTVDAVITDGNPSGGNMGVADAVIQYSIDGGSFTDVAMTGAEPNYSGEIPGQVTGTQITYRIQATDVNGNVSITLPVVYNIFGPENPNLVVFNGYDTESGYPQDYYFGEDVQSGTTTFAHDVWAFGPLTMELVENYNNIFEYATTGPADYNDDVIRDWLAAEGGTRNYFLAGMEWLGLKLGFADTTYVAGDFEYDILGVAQLYNDVSFDGTSGQELPTLVFPQEGTMFGGPLFDAFNANPTDSMQHNPNFEITVVNWIDAFEIVGAEGGQEVDMMLETRGILSMPDVQVLPCATHLELPNGNKTVFLSYDPLSLNSAPVYTWYGYTNDNTPYQALAYFGIATGVVKDDNLIPGEFSISQNYPNPFNPSTTIKFSVPQQSNVILKVYDILGSEVAVLVNEKVEAGNYTIDFDASQLASGMYIYSIKAGEFNVSKKMMLLK
ncbi:MAG: T9SS type A sorting domain-containing protein [Bacteroidetes bacterium]|nr:T9SS type A sorting domain-containing protein [Bacteroidota bacterium]